VVKTVRIVALALAIVSELQYVVIPLKDLDREKLRELFGKLHNLLGNDDLQTTIPKHEFIDNIDKYIELYARIVDVAWFISPRIFHALTWKVTGIKQEVWKRGIQLAHRYLANYIQFDPLLDQKINYHIHQYNLNVLSALLRKDFERSIELYRVSIQRSIEQAIAEEKAKRPTDLPLGNWLYYRDHTGLYKNPDWKEVTHE